MLDVLDLTLIAALTPRDLVESVLKMSHAGPESFLEPREAQLDHPLEAGEPLLDLGLEAHAGVTEMLPVAGNVAATGV